MKITENGQKIMNYLRDTKNANAVAADIADAVGLAKAQVNGSVNALVKKDLAYREEVEVVEGDSTVAVKFIKLTDTGMTVSYDED